MKQQEPSGTSFMVRNNSLNKQPAQRINSLQKQLNQLSIHKRKTDSCEAKEQSSAIMRLLQIKDQHVEWKDKNLTKKSLKSKNNNRFINQTNDNEDQLVLFEGQENNKDDFRQQQYLTQRPPFLENILNKRNSVQELNTKNSQLKKSLQFPQYENHILPRQFNNHDNLFMNQTYYRNRQIHNSKISHQTNQDFSLTQRFNNRFFPKTFYEKQTDDSLRVNSNFEFYRNKSPLEKVQFNDQQNSKKIGQTGANENNKLIKIQPNKSITVRQMLQKISSHEDIRIAEPSKQYNQLKAFFDYHENRQPFDPFTKKSPRQHYKKFTPFKIEQERKLEYSLQKLEEQIRRNPEIDNKWDEIQIKYLEKPNYCSWVERNKEKIKRKRNNPLTVRTLKLLN